MIKPILIVHQTTQDKTHIVVKWVTYFVMSFDIFSELLIQQKHKNQECIISLLISFTRNKKKDVLT